MEKKFLSGTSFKFTCIMPPAKLAGYFREYWLRRYGAQQRTSFKNSIVADVILSPNPSNGYFNIRLRDFRPISINVKVLYLNSSKVYFISKANNNSTTNISMHAPFDNYVVELSASP